MAKTLIEPMARIAAWGHAGVAPGVMGIGPFPPAEERFHGRALERERSKSLSSTRPLRARPSPVCDSWSSTPNG